jgi:hypothetical protein
MRAGGAIRCTARGDWSRDEALEAAKESREAGASADGYDAKARCGGFL